MMVELSDELSEELNLTLAMVISDMSSEIADTDNPGYRRELQARRARLQLIVDAYESAAPTGQTGSPSTSVLERS